MKRFHAAVYRLVERIPRGRVATYGQIAALIGYPRAARAVGRAMKHVPGHLPWHRVVNAQGGISRRANVGGNEIPSLRTARPASRRSSGKTGHQARHPRSG